MRYLNSFMSFVNEKVNYVLCHEDDKKKMQNPSAAITSGAEVTKLNSMLRAKGLLTSGTGSDQGVFGDKTREAVMKFQQEKGLTVDGIVGSNTMAALKEGGSSPAGKSETMRLGSTGKPVLHLKNMLRAGGYLKALSFGGSDEFDKETEQAVVAFQKANKLNPDGIVGPNTMGVLTGKGAVLRDMPKQRKAAPKEKEAEGSWLGELMQSAKNILLGKLFGVPLHIRMCLNYINRSKSAVTERFLTKEELQALYAVIEHKKKETGKEVSKLTYEDYSKWAIANGDNENVYHKTMKSQDKLYGDDQKEVTPFNAEGVATHLSLSLGEARVEPKGDGYVVSDTYDFNCIENNPEAYEWSKFPDTFKDSIKKIKKGNLVGGVEELLSWNQKAGYSGFPVRVTLDRTKLA
jgi:peptidoglycan hydrolase-like protein with peptidoglycan-binding domain